MKSRLKVSPLINMLMSFVQHTNHYFLLTFFLPIITYQTCSRGSACNFLHCFTNPGGDYEWADCDKPPPRFWVTKMVALFGYSEDDTWHQPTPRDQHRIFTSDRVRFAFFLVKYFLDK